MRQQPIVVASAGALVLSLVAVCVGCGGRSGLLVDERPDDERADAGPAPTRPDASAGETCVAGDPFELLRTAGPLSHPRLERIEEAAILLVTRAGAGRPTLVALPIDVRGRARGALREIGAGSGGTIVGASLDPSGPPTFTLSFTDGSGVLAGARLDLDGNLVASGTLGIVSSTDRPLLVITPELVANGWSVAGRIAGEGFVQDLRTRETTPISFEGDDPHGEVASVGRFHAVSHLGGRAIVQTIDGRGGGPPARELRLADLTDTPFPVQVQLTRIADGPDDSLLIGGGTIRALFDAIVHLQLGAAAHTRFFEDDSLLDADVAYDRSSGWLGAAAAILHDEVGVRTPHVFFLGLDPLRRTTEIVLASAIPADAVHPAILAIGRPDASFLVVWEASADTLDGVLVSCGRR